MSNTTTNARRGRPSFPVNIATLPDKFTVNDLVTANPQITCRLSLYTKRTRLVQKRYITATKTTVPTGGVSKPLTVYTKTAKGKAVTELVTV